MEDKRELFHQIRNCLNPLKTFLEAVDTSSSEPDLRKFHTLCRDSFTRLVELIKRLEETEK